MVKFFIFMLISGFIAHFVSENVNGFLGAFLFGGLIFVFYMIDGALQFRKDEIDDRNQD